jgi:hypothetical protein
MKKADKAFDCVRYKDELQARLRREYAGLTDEQVRQRIRRKLATSQSSIAKLWRTLEARDKVEAKASSGRGVRRPKKVSRKAVNSES